MWYPVSRKWEPIEDSSFYFLRTAAASALFFMDTKITGATRTLLFCSIWDFFGRKVNFHGLWVCVENFKHRFRKIPPMLQNTAVLFSMDRILCFCSDGGLWDRRSVGRGRNNATFMLRTHGWSEGSFINSRQPLGPQFLFSMDMSIDIRNASAGYS